MALCRRSKRPGRRRKPDAMACFVPAISNHGRAAGREGMARIYESLYTAFADYHFDVELLWSMATGSRPCVVRRGPTKASRSCLCSAAYYIRCRPQADVCRYRISTSIGSRAA